MATEVVLRDATTNSELVEAFATDTAGGGKVGQLFSDYMALHGRNMESYLKDQEVATNFGNAAAYGFGVAAVNAMAAKPDINVLSVDIPMGNDTLQIQVDRTKETSDGHGGRMTHHGYMTVGYTRAGAGGGKGEMLKIRNEIKRRAAEQLGQISQD